MGINYFIRQMKFLTFAVIATLGFVGLS